MILTLSPGHNRENDPVRHKSGAPPVEDDPIVTFRLFRLQELEAPFQNATSRDWQKAFNPQRELGAFCSGVKVYLTVLFN